MDRILVIDDNLQIQKLVAVNLQARGYGVQLGGSGEEAIDLFKVGQFDLILLDLILPGISGIDVCTWIRQQSDIPIIVLSAREDEELKVRALDAGADDYVTKPFSQEELLARVRAVMRRAKAGTSDKKSEIHIKDLTVNLAAHRAYINGVDMHLTRTEFAILGELAKNPEAVMTTKTCWRGFGVRNIVIPTITCISTWAVCARNWGLKWKRCLKPFQAWDISCTPKVNEPEMKVLRRGVRALGTSARTPLLS